MTLRKISPRRKASTKLMHNSTILNGPQVGGRFNAANLLLWAGLPPSETLGKCGKCKIVEHLFGGSVPVTLYLVGQTETTPAK